MTVRLCLGCSGSHRAMVRAKAKDLRMAWENLQLLGVALDDDLFFIGYELCLLLSFPKKMKETLHVCIMHKQRDWL